MDGVLIIAGILVLGWTVFATRTGGSEKGFFWKGAIGLILLVAGILLPPTLSPLFGF